MATIRDTDGAEAVPAAVERDELAAVADRLVEQARADGVALTGDGGLLTGLVQQVLQTALEVELETRERGSGLKYKHCHGLHGR